MSDAVKLPDLATLRTRWRTLAGAFHSRGIDNIWMSGDTADSYVDPAGSRMDLVQFNPSRAVLTAFDRELTDPAPRHPLDFFAEAPPWVPRAPIVPSWPLGDLIWFEDGRWQRSTSVRDVPRAVEVLATPLLDDESLADELRRLPPPS
ncbi:MAG: hypothetical protein ABI435_04005 [Pseudolysinimonas sp.]